MDGAQVKAAVVEGAGRLTVREWADPDPGRSALVRVGSGGICGTDLKIVKGEVPADVPVILGHEVVGWVEVPAPGSLIPAGARVVVDPSFSCGLCRVCRRDLPHLCPDGGLIGRDADGGFAQLIAVPDSRLHVLPADMPAADAVLLQVLSTCVHAQTRIRPQLGQTGLVVGLGTAGLLHVQLLAARGVRTIVGVSRSAAKRALAAELGATVVAAPGDALAAVAEVTDGWGADIAIECAGQTEALVQAMTAAGHGASVLIFGTIAPAADRMPTYDWYRKELTLLNTRAARPRDFTAAISAVRDGLVRAARLVTSSYPLDEIEAAVAAAARADEIKVMLTVADQTARSAGVEEMTGQAPGPNLGKGRRWRRRAYRGHGPDHRLRPAGAEQDGL
jgi:threonine dehydrogenase-like Zn-dependent dehydrogenase